MLEGLCRSAVCAALLWLLWIALAPDRQASPEWANSSSLAGALIRWSTSLTPERVTVELDSLPSGEQRDWLAALAAAGSRVHWNGSSLLPIAASAEPRADPNGGVEVRVAAPALQAIVLSDELGTLDSTAVQRTGAVFSLPSTPHLVAATVRGQTALAAVQDSLELRPILVLGDAGWEAKFTVAALEEHGWKVETHLKVSPKGDVLQGKLGPLDTSRYSAVIALDTSTVHERDRITRFVRQGGGLILGPGPGSARAFATLATGRAGKLIPEQPLLPGSPDPRRVLAFRPVAELKSDAIPLQYRATVASVIARRVGLGRVVQIGYGDVWRWRMGGAAGAADAHRAWWAALVTAVAHAGRTERAPPSPDAAPYASLFDRLGPPSPSDHLDTSAVPTPWSWWMFVSLVAALLLEWGSRRLRGVK